MKNKVDSKLMQILSRNIETIRTNSNLKKKEMALKLGVSATYLTEIVNCHFCVSLDILEQFAAKTGYTASQLLSESADCFKFASTFQSSHR